MSHHLRLTVTLLSVLLLLSHSNPIAADDPRRPQDAKQATTPEPLVAEIERALKEVEDPQLRFEMMRMMIHRLQGCSRGARAPLLELFKQTVAQVDDQRLLLGSSESVTAWDPTFSVETARRLDDERLRDHCLRRIVRSVASDDRALAERLLQEIQTSGSRMMALGDLALYSSLRFDELQALFAEYVELAKTSDNRAHHPRYILNRGFIPFAQTNTREIIAFAHAHLEPEDVVYLLAGLASDRLNRKDDVETAAVLFDEAVKLVPKSHTPSQTALELLDAGYGRLRPEQALELFDQRILPSVERQSGEFPLAVLASVDIDAVFPRAEQLAEKFSRPPDEFAARILGHAAHRFGPANYIDWLRQAEPSQVRERAVAQVAFGAWGYYGNASARTYFQREELDVKAWVSDLWSVGRTITDEDFRFDACVSLLRLAETGKVAPPRALVDEFAALFPKATAKKSFYEVDLVARSLVQLLPLHEQRRLIRRRRAGARPEDTLTLATALVRSSTLPRTEKRRFYRDIRSEALLVSDLRQQVNILTGVATCMGSLDFREALKLMDEARDIASRHGVAGISRDLIGPIGPAGAPASVEAGVDYLVAHAKPRAANAVEGLRQHVKGVPAADRNAVRVGLSRVLIQQRRLDEALEEARRITAPQRRAETLADVAEAMFPQ